MTSENIKNEKQLIDYIIVSFCLCMVVAVSAVMHLAN